MIQNLDINQSQGLFKRGREQFVGTAGFGFEIVGGRASSTAQQMYSSRPGHVVAEPRMSDGLKLFI